MTADPALLSPPDAGPDSWFQTIPGERCRIRLDSRRIGGRQTVIETIALPEIGPPLHSHRQDELFLVLEGRLAFRRGEERLRAGPGTLLLVPAGQPHAWRNIGDTPSRMLVTFTPGGVEEMFLNLAGVPPEGLADYARRHEIAVLGPPIAP